MRIGVIGDVHRLFDDEDIAQLDARGYDRIFFVGDLATFTHRGGLEVAQRIARLVTPALVIPGNHDAANVGQMVAEMFEANAILPLLNVGQPRRVRQLRSALGRATVAGYSVHPLEPPWGKVAVIAGRPHSAGGTHLAFRPHLKAFYDVDSMERSAAKLEALVDASEADELIFLAHNGPSGLGDRRADIWGCDFRASEGDFGDPDLERAIRYARTRGKKVRAVVAGHMHHRLRGGGERRWLLERDGTLYVNAARVPRIFRRGERKFRHHVELVLDAEKVHAREVLLESGA